MCFVVQKQEVSDIIQGMASKIENLEAKDHELMNICCKITIALDGKRDK